MSATAFHRLVRWEVSGGYGGKNDRLLSRCSKSKRQATATFCLENGWHGVGHEIHLKPQELEHWIGSVLREWELETQFLMIPEYRCFI